MKPTHLFTTVLSLSSIAVAWPWPKDPYVARAVDGLQAMAQKRQDSSASTASRTQAASTTSGASRTASASGSNTASGTNSNSRSGTITSSPSSTSGSDSDSSSNSTATDSVDFDARLPAGGVSMISPAPTQGAQYYKIGDWVTFAWNYTSLLATPTAINVLASCSANKATYTLAANMSVGNTNTVLWDTGEFSATASIPLLTNQYTLIIEDAGGSVTDAPRAGYLAVQKTFMFGMYQKQSYTPWSDFNCATCNGAFSLHERQTLGFLLGMASLTVLSFTWFASGFGVF